MSSTPIGSDFTIATLTATPTTATTLPKNPILPPLSVNDMNPFTIVDGQGYAIHSAFSVLNYLLMSPDAFPPSKGSVLAAGFDLKTPFDIVVEGMIFN